MGNKKKILIHTLIFSPDGVSTAYIYKDIALAFKKSGYDVVVLSTTPHFNLVDEQLAEQPLKWGVWGIYKKSIFNEIPVYHVPQKKFYSTILRLIGFVYWHTISFLMGLFIRDVDVILSPSPPLTIGFLNLLLGKIKKCKVVYNVQEIYPDILGKSSGLVFNLLSKIEHKVYNCSDAVTTIDKVFYDTIVNRFIDKRKLHITPNFVDIELYKPFTSTDVLDKNLFPKNNNIKLLYAGNIGHAQSWEPLIELAKKTKEQNIDYYVIGEGVKKSYVEKQKIANKLDNIHILPYQPRHLMPSIIAYSDIQFIFMDPNMDMQGFPSKVYTIMACGKPLLVCSGEGTPIVNFLQEFDCAKLITNKNLSKKIDEMVEWLHNVSKEDLINMGNNGVDAIRKYYTKDIVSKQYVELINSLIYK